MKVGFYLRMLKPESAQSSVDALTFTEQVKRNYKTNLSHQANGSSFLGQEGSADGGIQVTRDHNNVRIVLQKTKTMT
jgi:hypothetical protein